MISRCLLIKNQAREERGLSSVEFERQLKIRTEGGWIMRGYSMEVVVACQRVFNIFVFILGLMTAALVFSSNGEAREQLDVCYYDSQGNQHDADWCYLGWDISHRDAVNLSPHCRNTAGAVCHLEHSGDCRTGSHKYSKYVVFPSKSGRCPTTYRQAVVKSKSGGGVTPSCPQGYVFSGGQCVVSTPVPACPDGFEFSNGQCVRASRPSSSGQWVFVVNFSLGVKSALELDGASVCLVPGSASQAAATGFFQTNGLNFLVVRDNNLDSAMSTYDKGACDVLVVEERIANATIDRLSRPSDHGILPERIDGSIGFSPPPVRRTAPRPVNLAFPMQSELKRLGCLRGRVDGVWGSGSRSALTRFARQKGLRLGSEPSQAALAEARKTNTGYCRTVRTRPQLPRASRGCQPRFNACMKKAGRISHPRENYEMEQDCKRQLATCSRKKSRKWPRKFKQKVRCSNIKYAFTRGNTCRCSRGRIFNGRACVKRKTGRDQRRQCNPVSVCNKRYNSCRANIEIEGNRKGWDGDLRRDEHDSTCLPQKKRCLAKSC